MPPKRKRASSSKNEEDAQFIATTNDNNNLFEQRMEELLNSIKNEVLGVSKEVSELKNENKTIKETVYEMKESICAMKNEMKDEMRTQNDVIKHIKHTIDEMKTKVDDNPTPLWKLVTEWKDVFESEILTKLNGTEHKLFSQTCRASREAIKRAKIELRRKFWIYELSSISQLELAWANYQWGAKAKYPDGEEYTKNQETFCRRVAETNDLALLRWVREEKECAWDWITSDIAAILGNLEMLKYCVENGCEVHTGTCAEAAKFGNLECLKYLREKNCPWDDQTVQDAHENNHIACLTYAIQQKCPGFEDYANLVPKQ
jgi:archaellum component FlaC